MNRTLNVNLSEGRYMDKPERKHFLTVKVEADSLKELAIAIKAIAHRIEAEGRIAWLIVTGKQINV